MAGYKILDLFFLLFHSAIVLFNLFGWIWKRTLKWNLVTLLLTGGSWFILGIFYGMGYCPLTDWHFQVLRHLGNQELPNSYMKYIGDRITGLDFDAALVDTLTLVCFLAALSVSLTLNVLNWYRKRKF